MLWHQKWLCCDLVCDLVDNPHSLPLTPHCRSLREPSQINCSACQSLAVCHCFLQHGIFQSTFAADDLEISTDHEQEPLVSRPVSGSFSRLSSSSRSHSNSLSLAATNGNHRVHRRKSVNASASSTAQAAIAAALRENGEPLPLPTHRRSIPTKKSESHSLSGSGRPNMHSYFPAGTTPSIENDTFEDMSMDEDETSTKRNRRASEGSHLMKSKKNELRCDTCGKGYKHSSCLTKHMYGS